MNCITKNKKLNRGIALGLIALSFLLYAIMPFNICLPYSACVIAGITGAMMAISEIVFWVGSLMIGREVAAKIRAKINIFAFLKKRKRGNKDDILL